MDQENNKINDYFNLLKKRVIKRIDTPEIQKSCTTTLLLIFAAIDSLSKITCGDDDYQKYTRNKSGNKSRFDGFLENIMGGKYSDYKEEIYELRCDIVHTGINTNLTLSRDKNHLEEVNGNLWINTNQFLQDFKKVMQQIEADIQNKSGYFNNASNRLKEFNVIDIMKEDDGPSPSADVFE